MPGKPEAAGGAVMDDPYRSREAILEEALRVARRELSEARVAAEKNKQRSRLRRRLWQWVARIDAGGAPLRIEPRRPRRHCASRWVSAHRE